MEFRATFLFTKVKVFRQAFISPSFETFKAYVWAMMIVKGSKCMTKIAESCFFVGKHISSVELKGAEREASIKRGGNGYVAEFHRGYLVAGQNADRNLSLTGKEMTLCIRMRDSLGKWDMPLFGRYDGDDPLSGILYGVDVDTKPFLLNSPYYLFAEKGEEQATRGSKALLEFRWRTEPLDRVIERFKNREDDDPIVSDARNGVLPLRVPVELIGPTDWHDVVVRFNGPNLEMFVDGVLVDEDWPYS